MHGDVRVARRRAPARARRVVMVAVALAAIAGCVPHAADHVPRVPVTVATAAVRPMPFSLTATRIGNPTRPGASRCSFNARATRFGATPSL